jgi:hypothetical protein
LFVAQYPLAQHSIAIKLSEQAFIAPALP